MMRAEFAMNRMGRFLVFAMVEDYRARDARRPNTIQYEATVDDPETWTRPWTVSLPFKQQPDYGMYEYACHEGNYGMRNILSGARAEEAGK
jgi:hypothetical protein